MPIIVVEEIVLEEGAIEGVGVRDAIRIVEEESRKESGCLAFAFSVDISDPTTMRVYEQWESMEALEADLNANHMAVFQRALALVRPYRPDCPVHHAAVLAMVPRAGVSVVVEDHAGAELVP